MTVLSCTWRGGRVRPRSERQRIARRMRRSRSARPSICLRIRPAPSRSKTDAPFGKSQPYRWSGVHIAVVPSAPSITADGRAFPPDREMYATNALTDREEYAVHISALSVAKNDVHLISTRLSDGRSSRALRRTTSTVNSLIFCRGESERNARRVPRALQDLRLSGL